MQMERKWREGRTPREVIYEKSAGNERDTGKIRSKQSFLEYLIQINSFIKSFIDGRLERHELASSSLDVTLIP